MLRTPAPLNGTLGAIAMYRAADKQNESAFFLERLVDALLDEDPSWRYYFNATVTAARSITLVLQKDLRPLYGETFDLWWAEKRKTLVNEAEFRLVRDLRNILEKEGARYPILAGEVSLSDSVFRRVRFELDMSMGNKALTIRDFEFSNPKLELPDSTGETAEQLDERIHATVSDLLKMGFEEFRAALQKPTSLTAGILLPGITEPVAILDGINYIANYLRSTAALINEAKVQFHDFAERYANRCGCRDQTPENGT